MVDWLSGDRTDVCSFAGQAAAIVEVIKILNLITKKESWEEKSSKFVSDNSKWNWVLKLKKSYGREIYPVYKEGY